MNRESCALALANRWKRDTEKEISKQQLHFMNRHITKQHITASNRKQYSFLFIIYKTNGTYEKALTEDYYF